MEEGREGKWLCFQSLSGLITMLKDKLPSKLLPAVLLNLYKACIWVFSFQARVCTTHQSVPCSDLFLRSERQQYIPMLSLSCITSQIQYSQSSRKPNLAL